MIFSRIIVLANSYPSAHRIALMNISRGRYFKMYKAEKGRIELSEMSNSFMVRVRSMPTVFYRTNAELMKEVNIGDVFLMDVISDNKETGERMYDIFIRVA